MFALLAGGSLLLAPAFAISTLPEIPPGTWANLGLVAVLCACYYFVRAGFPEWERGRAVVVGGIFAADTLLAAPGLGGGLFCWLGLALGALFTANVRVCIWSEGSRTLFRPLVLSAVGFLFVAIGGHLLIALAGSFALAGLGLLFSKRRELKSENLAMAADAALFAPPLMVLALWLRL